MGISIAASLGSVRIRAGRTAASPLWPSNAKFKTKFDGKQAFDMEAFLDSPRVTRKVVEYGRNKTAFTQGGPATSLFYVRNGGLKLAVVNKVGKEAVAAILGPGDFAGEECLAGCSIYLATAIAIVPTAGLLIQRNEMIRLLRMKGEFSDHFIGNMLARKIRIEEDLISLLIYSSEKRLARILLMLAGYGKGDSPRNMVADISQETLAEMIGTTRSRVNQFMTKFRKLGFIEYGSKLREVRINKSLYALE
jgi:CRP-like cAMP-binding protein